jgi:hypothetical protein
LNTAIKFSFNGRELMLFKALMISNGVHSVHNPMHYASRFLGKHIRNEDPNIHDDNIRGHPIHPTMLIAQELLELQWFLQQELLLLV